MPKPLTCLILLMAGAVATAADPAPLKVCLVSGSEEYKSDDSLAAFRDHLEANYPASCTLLKARGFGDLPGLAALQDCDVALVFTRRLTIGGEQLALVKKYVEAGRPLVAVRTASHGFQNWPAFDKDVLGGNYRGHYRNDLTMRATVAPGAAGHPVLDGVRMIASLGSLYKTSPPAADARVLLVGSSPEGTEPAAWAREVKDQRIVYTSLGSRGDFENATFKRLLANSLFWAARRDLVRNPPAVPADRPRPEGMIRLKLRARVEPAKGSGLWQEVNRVEELPIAETAIIICDLWDRHWCGGATRRCGPIAERLAPMIRSARARGVQIVHAPSDCMDFYAETPQRRRLQLAPPVSPPKPLALPDPPLPIDDAGGGCDTGEPMYLAWTRQDPRVDLGEFDGISDSGAEIYSFFRKLGIKNVILTGVHTNMCVLNRTFAIKQMTRLGLHCILARDLTDTMYDPKDRPHVSHDEGTGLVVEYIEKYWAPSILSTDLMAGLPR